MRRPLLAALLTLAAAGPSCLAPGVDIVPAPGDFAFIEIQLQG